MDAGTGMGAARAGVGASAPWLAVALAALVSVGAPEQGSVEARAPISRCCAAAQDPAAAAHEAFGRGMQLFRSSGGKELALEPLCRASCCWPRPDPDVSISHGVVSETYQPVYWRGRFYLESRQHRNVCSALRYLNLATCEWEKVDEGKREKLQSPREKAEEARRERQRSPWQFGNGVFELKHDKWRAAAHRMLEALSRWDEDGDGTRIQGRFLDHYLPRYYLGRALLELGCTRDAIGVMRCSEVSWCLLRTDELEDVHPATLLAEAEPRLDVPQAQEPEICGELRVRMEALDVDLDGCCACAGC